ncbi:uncharacterized protein LOC144639802 [Oculina patagonica]
MFRTLFQLAICITIISRSLSFARKISLEDEEINIREFNKFDPRERPRYQHSQQFKRDGVILPEVYCQPHLEVVQVEPDVTNERNKPQFVTVSRCRGACDRSLDSQRCSPNKTRLIPVQVISTDGVSFIQDVEEHLTCVCECQLECTEHHYPDEKNCRCNCIDKCNENENQDPTTCVCTPRVGKRRDEIIED